MSDQTHGLAALVRARANLAEARDILGDTEPDQARHQSWEYRDLEVVLTGLESVMGRYGVNVSDKAIGQMGWVPAPTPPPVPGPKPFRCLSVEYGTPSQYRLILSYVALPGAAQISARLWDPVTSHHIAQVMFRREKSGCVTVAASDDLAVRYDGFDPDYFTIIDTVGGRAGLTGDYRQRAVVILGLVQAMFAQHDSS